MIGLWVTGKEFGAWCGLWSCCFDLVCLSSEGDGMGELCIIMLGSCRWLSSP